MHKQFVEQILARRPDKFVQLVKHVDEVPESKLKFPCVMQIKYDGVYCAMIVIGGVAKAYSRTGNAFTNLEGLESSFSGMHEGVYIGEVVNSLLSLEELSGAINCNRKKPLDEYTERYMENSEIYLHDFLTLDEFNAGYSSTPYIHRYCDLVEIHGGVFDSLNVILVKAIPCYSMGEFSEFSDYCIKIKHEGAVLKQYADWEAGHKGYRVTKKVRGIHVDLKCIGVHYGKGKREGLIAALEFEYKGKKFKADLGKGWDDAKRLQLTFDHEGNTSDAPIGKIFHVKGLQESSKGVIRLPKVQEMRIDKTESD